MQHANRVADTQSSADSLVYSYVLAGIALLVAVFLFL